LANDDPLSQPSSSASVGTLGHSGMAHPRAVGATSQAVPLSASSASGRKVRKITGRHDGRVAEVG
jgi:hypothetical protein